MPLSLSLHQGDITQQNVDAIVNAANSALRGGGGVDGAIHRAAGPGLLKECIPLGPCATGDVRVTGAHGLKAKWVIHAVGPVWQGGTRGEDDALAACYLRSLGEAVNLGAKSIAFPAISTGVYAFPLERAAGVVARAFSEFARVHPEADLDVRLVLFGDAAVTAFSKRFATGQGVDVQV